MRFKTTLWAFIALCLLASLAWLIEHRIKSTDEQKKHASKLLQMVPDSVNYLSMTRDEFHIECRKINGRWFLKNPQNAPITRGKIETILRLLATVPKGDVISLAEIGDKGLTPNDYGLEKPRARFVFGDDQSRQELLIGADASLGDMLYVTLRDSEEISTVFRGILDLIPEEIDDLRERSLFSISPEQVRYVCFQKNENKLVLTKGDGGWVITDPVQYKADDQIMDTLIPKITALRVKSFVTAAVTNFTERGLDPPVHIVQLAKGTNDIESAGPNRLLIGTLREGAETVFIKHDQIPFIYEVSPSSVKGYVENITDPRKYVSRSILKVPEKSVHRLSIFKNEDRQVVARNESGEWTSVLPTEREVDQKKIKDILMFTADLRALRVEALSPTDLVVYGLDDCKTILSLGIGDDQESEKDLLIGSRAKGGGMYAMIRGQNIVFVFEEVLAELLTRDLMHGVSSHRQE